MRSTLPQLKLPAAAHRYGQESFSTEDMKDLAREVAEHHAQHHALHFLDERVLGGRVPRGEMAVKPPNGRESGVRPDMAVKNREIS